jgi:hypothetical protein
MRSPSSASATRVPSPPQGPSLRLLQYVHSKSGGLLVSVYWPCIKRGIFHFFSPFTFLKNSGAALKLYAELELATRCPCLIQMFPLVAVWHCTIGRR